MWQWNAKQDYDACLGNHSIVDPTPNTTLTLFGNTARYVGLNMIKCYNSFGLRINLLTNLYLMWTSWDTFVGVHDQLMLGVYIKDGDINFWLNHNLLPTHCLVESRYHVWHQP